MFDPFAAFDPPVLVHELDGPNFEAAWTQATTAGEEAREETACPMCGQRGVTQHGTSPNNQRPWIRFACGDVVTQEITAG